MNFKSFKDWESSHEEVPFFSRNNGSIPLNRPHPLINILCFMIGVLGRRTGNLLTFGTSVFGIYELDK